MINYKNKYLYFKNKYIKLRNDYNQNGGIRNVKAKSPPNRIPDKAKSPPNRIPDKAKSPPNIIIHSINPGKEKIINLCLPKYILLNPKIIKTQQILLKVLKIN